MKHKQNGWWLVPGIIVAIMTLVACSNDDDSEPLNLLGKWRATKIVMTEPIFDANGDGVNSMNLLEELPCRYILFEFKNDETIKASFNLSVYHAPLEQYICVEDVNLPEDMFQWSPGEDQDQIGVIYEGSTVYVPLQYDGETLSHQSIIPLFDRNAAGEEKLITGTIYYERYE
ncbi:MAG: hypothetical protein HEP71_17010 [Roseivirga sp.]|nr:hypothetical protein [Roseivirga sp.]